MKHLNTFFALLVLFVSTTVFAQEPSPAESGGGGASGPVSLPMIVSRDALRSYAVEQVARVAGNTYSSSMIQSPGPTHFSFAVIDRPVDIAAVRKLVSKHELVPTIVNPADYVSFNVWYGSAGGDTLFGGGTSTQFKKNAQTGQWELPSLLGFELYLNYEIPIVVSNVYHARLTLEDETGRTIRQENIRVDERTGKIYFPSLYAGAAGFLIIDTFDRRTETPRTHIFDMRTGRSSVPVRGSSSLSPTINNFVEARASSGSVLEFNVQSYNGFGESPTVQLRVEGSGEVQPLIKVVIGALTTEGERAEWICVRRIGSETIPSLGWNCVPAFTIGGTQTILLFEPGLYHVIFQWKSFRPYPVLPTDGGGKG